jgi:hypothetical protein
MLAKRAWGFDMAEEQSSSRTVEAASKSGMGGGMMKRLGRSAIFSAVLATAITGCPAHAQRMAGAVVLEDMGQRDYPAGYNETGRYARFIQDMRLTDINLQNRDFEDWKPLDVRTRNFTRHFLNGKANTSYVRVPDQEIGRYVPQMEDYRLEANNIEYDNRTFYPYQINSPYTARANSAMSKSYLRGLPVGTNLEVAWPRRASLPVGSAKRLLYFWQ